MLKGELTFGQFTFFAYFCSRLYNNIIGKDGQGTDCQYCNHWRGHGAAAGEGAAEKERQLLVTAYPRQPGDEGQGHSLCDRPGPRDAADGKDGCQRADGIKGNNVITK